MMWCLQQDNIEDTQQDNFEDTQQDNIEDTQQDTVREGRQLHQVVFPSLLHDTTVTSQTRSKLQQALHETSCFV